MGKIYSKEKENKNESFKERETLMKISNNSLKNQLKDKFRHTFIHSGEHSLNFSDEIKEQNRATTIIQENLNFKSTKNLKFNFQNLIFKDVFYSARSSKMSFNTNYGHCFK